MDTSNTLAVENVNEIVELPGKSWTAYVPLTFVALFFFLLATPFGYTISPALGLAILTLTAIYCIYKILMIRSCRLYYDANGVWLYSGVFPWDRGVRGVKWRDIDEAVMFRSLWSWLFKSYSIRIGHRFTKASEIGLTSMHKGDISVTTINHVLQQKVSSTTFN